MQTERVATDIDADTPWAGSDSDQPPSEHLERLLDEALDATFPCSDPVSTLCVELRTH